MGNAFQDVTAEQFKRPIADIIDKATESIITLAFERGVEIELQNEFQEAELLVEAGVVTRALCHFLVSAVRATSRGGRVSIIVAPAPHGGISISIRDQGPGMRQEMASQVSSKFESEKVENGIISVRQPDLVLAKNLIEAVDGRVRIDPDTDNGTLASISLPPSRVSKK